MSGRLHQESWRTFVREVASIFRALGADVEHDVALAGMQIDIIIREQMPSGAIITSAVECKYYTRPVGSHTALQFAGAAHLLRDRSLIDRAIIVALSGFTRQAREVARASNIDLLEFDHLKQRLAHVKPTALEEARKAVEADEVTQTIPRQPHTFVVMPFAAEFQDVYILGIREVAEKLGFVVERADDIEHNEAILQVIQERIRDTDAIIADTTGRNPNVFYEIGYAHALNKPTILISRRGPPLPFDVQSMNIIMYENIVELRERLENRIKGTVLMKGCAPSVQKS